MAWKIAKFHVKGYVAITVVIFVSFIIGVNLGMHGVLVVLQNDLKYITHGQYSNSGSVTPIKEANINHLPTIYNKETNTVNPAISPEVPIKVIRTNSLSTDSKPTEDKQNDQTQFTIHDKMLAISNVVDSYSIKVYNEILERNPNIATKENTQSKDIPIVLLTCNRPELLRKTIDSLLKVRGIKKSNIIISQDGALPEIAEIAKQSSLTLIQNLNGLRLRGGASTDGASRIAKHYKYSLTTVFNQYPNANSLIIIEDDLLFSPDFYEYFQYNSPILEFDSTAFVLSAWSDNGFSEKIHDPYELRRTDYFPGLGWLLTRRLYKEELEGKWPDSHWDHWLRAPETSKSRDIIYPQIPRSYHNGIKGTFMNLETHNKYFRDIGYNTNTSIHWPPPPATTPTSGILSLPVSKQHQPGDRDIGNSLGYLKGHYKVDAYRIEQLAQACKHVSSVKDLLGYRDEIICLWVSINPSCESPHVPFAPVAAFFGLWHEHRRGNHQGLHEFYWLHNNYILLFNTYNDNTERNYHKNNNKLKKEIMENKNTYKYLMPINMKPLQNTQEFDKNILLNIKQKTIKSKIIKATKPGLNCNTICNNNGLKCQYKDLPIINTCNILKTYFSCNICINSNGLEQPAYVNPIAEEKYLPDKCLVNTGNDLSTCEASHMSTYRLCPCA